MYEWLVAQVGDDMALGIVSGVLAILFLAIVGVVVALFSRFHVRSGTISLRNESSDTLNFAQVGEQTSQTSLNEIQAANEVTNVFNNVMTQTLEQSETVKKRLILCDSVVIDEQRRLVLVRRDDVEHLILVGSAGDMVIEHNIPVESPEVDAVSMLAIAHPQARLEEYSENGNSIPEQTLLQAVEKDVPASVLKNQNLASHDLDNKALDQQDSIPYISDALGERSVFANGSPPERQDNVIAFTPEVTKEEDFVGGGNVNKKIPAELLVQANATSPDTLREEDYVKLAKSYLQDEIETDSGKSTSDQAMASIFPSQMAVPNDLAVHNTTSNVVKAPVEVQPNSTTHPFFASNIVGKDVVEKQAENKLEEVPVSSYFAGKPKKTLPLQDHELISSQEKKSDPAADLRVVSAPVSQNVVDKHIETNVQSNIVASQNITDLDRNNASSLPHRPVLPLNPFIRPHSQESSPNVAPSSPLPLPVQVAEHQQPVEPSAIVAEEFFVGGEQDGKDNGGVNKADVAVQYAPTVAAESASAQKAPSVAKIPAIPEGFVNSFLGYHLAPLAKSGNPSSGKLGPIRIQSSQPLANRINSKTASQPSLVK